MRAFQVTGSGAAPRHADLAKPVPGPGEIRVRIAACGLNFADLLMIRGTYQDTPPPPFTLGMEVSGTVEALGDGVTAPAVGTRVAVFAGHGGLAEFGVFPAARALPIPDAMSFTQAAARQSANDKTCHSGRRPTTAPAPKIASSPNANAFRS